MKKAKVFFALFALVLVLSSANLYAIAAPVPTDPVVTEPPVVTQPNNPGRHHGHGYGHGGFGWFWMRSWWCFWF